MSRCAPQQQPGLFRPDREHRRPGSGPCILARNLRDPTGGRRSKHSKNPSKPELEPINAAGGTSRHRRRNDCVRNSVKGFAFEITYLTVITASEMGSAAKQQFSKAAASARHVRFASESGHSSAQSTVHHPRLLKKPGIKRQGYEEGRPRGTRKRYRRI